MENTEAKIAELEAQVKSITAENDRLAKLSEPADRKSSYAADHSGINANTKFGTSSISPETKAFVKWVVTGQKSAEFKALTDGSAGQFAPTEFSHEIIARIFRQSVVRAAGATVIPMGSSQLVVPAGAATVTTSWIGENTLIPLTDPALTTLTLTAKKLTARTAISSELEEDSFLDVANYVADAMAGALARAEDAAFIAGANGSATTPSGITTNPGVGSVASTGASSGYDDFLRLYTALPVQYRPNATFLISDTDYGILLGLTNAQGTPLFQPTLAGDPGAVLFGRKVVSSPDVTAGTVYFGDMSKYVIGDRRKITIARTDDGAGAFEYDVSMVKATERVDGLLALPEAWKKLTGVTA